MASNSNSHVYVTGDYVAGEVGNDIVEGFVRDVDKDGYVYIEEETEQGSGGRELRVKTRHVLAKDPDRSESCRHFRGDLEVASDRRRPDMANATLEEWNALREKWRDEVVARKERKK